MTEFDVTIEMHVQTVTEVTKLVCPDIRRKVEALVVLYMAGKGIDISKRDAWDFFRYCCECEHENS